MISKEKALEAMAIISAYFDFVDFSGFATNEEMEAVESAEHMLIHFIEESK